MPCFNSDKITKMKIALIGYGRMGKEIEKIAVSRGHEIGLKIDITNPEDLNVENLQKCDVAIEFTIPASAINNYSVCFDAGIPVVSGTTAGLITKNRFIKNVPTRMVLFSTEVTFR